MRSSAGGENDRGQVGDGTTINRTTPVEVSSLSIGVATVSSGFRHTRALTKMGGIKCWGSNVANQLGDGTNIDRTTPVDVTDLTGNAAAVSVGWGQAS